MKYIGQKKKLEADLLTPEGQARWPAVIIVAGWQGDGIRNERSRQISEILLSAGFAVLRLNLPGHGKSQGERINFTLTQGRDAILTAVGWLKKQKQIDGSRVSVIATSIGGSVAILAAAKYRNFRSLVLLSPRTDFRNTDWETYRLRNSEEINRAIRRSGLALDFYRLAKKIKIPTLIFHGRADEFIPVEQSEKLLKNLASETKKLKLLNAGHQYSPTMFRRSNRQAAEFVIRHP